MCQRKVCVQQFKMVHLWIRVKSNYLVIGKLYKFHLPFSPHADVLYVCEDLSIYNVKRTNFWLHSNAISKVFYFKNVSIATCASEDKHMRKNKREKHFPVQIYGGFFQLCNTDKKNNTKRIQSSTSLCLLSMLFKALFKCLERDDHHIGHDGRPSRLHYDLMEQNMLWSSSFSFWSCSASMKPPFQSLWDLGL